MNYYGISMLFRYIQVLCGMKIVIIQGLKRDMLILKI